MINKNLRCISRILANVHPTSPGFQQKSQDSPAAGLGFLGVSALAGADPLKGEKLAVIGAGPIGLRAALELALLGAEVPGVSWEEVGELMEHLKGVKLKVH